MTGRYQVYDEFTSVEEVIIEDFPQHWDLTRIKFNSLVKARVGWHGLKSEDFTEEGPYLVTGSDFKGKYIQWRDCYHCDEERYQQDSYIQLKNGDLLLTKDGTIGKVALVSELDTKATLNSGVFVVRPLKDGDFTTKYYYWLLLSRSFTDFVDFYKTGSTIVHLYQDTFVNFKYSLPPLAEQQKLADFLDHETVKIDTLIAKQEKLIELLKEKRQAVILHAVTRGLNPNAPMKDSGVEWLGEVPEHWLHTSLKHYSNVIDCKHITAEFFDDGIPLASIGEVKGWFVNLKKAKLTNEKYYNDLIGGGRTPQVGDIIYSRNATVGEAAIVSNNLPLFALGQDVCLLRQSKNILSEYLMFVLHSGVISQQLDLAMVGSTFKRINVENIKSFLIALPPFEEQEKIVKELEKKSCKYDSLISNAVNAIELIKERKTALISAAVTGKIDVRNYNTEKAGD